MVTPHGRSLHICVGRKKGWDQILWKWYSTTSGPVALPQIGKKEGCYYCEVSRRSRRTARADRTKICFRKHSDICFRKHSDVVCWPWPNTAAAFGHLLPQGFSAIYYLPPQVFGSLYTPPGTARADWAKQPFHPFCASCISHAGRAPPRNAAFAVARFDGGASVGRAVRRAGLY